MFDTIQVPVWLAVLGGALAMWAALDRLLLPSVRWFFRRRINRVLGEVRERLHIEIPPFALTKRQILIERLTFDPEVQAAAAALAAEEGAPREVVMARVARYAREIVPAFNAYFYFRLGFWCARRLSSLFYRVRMGYADDAGLRAIDPKSTPVFIINHRSNMDYVLVAFLAAERTALSYAVGEWARVWPLMNLIKMMGGFFVRRGSGNPLYRKVLERYVKMATEGGVPQAIFPEGGLSKDGKLRPPKLGLLDYMLRGFDAKGPRDVAFIPVGINYDRVVEDRTLLRGLDADAPRLGAGFALATTAKFLWRNLVLALRGRWYSFGYACVNFGTPVSLKRHLKEHGIELDGMDAETRIAHVTALAQDLMGHVARVIPVLPVSLVAAVFRARAAEGSMSELALKAAAYDAMTRLDAQGALTYIPRADRDYAITVGLRMLKLRHMVDEGADGLWTIRPENRALLDFYANAIAHLLPEAGAAEAA
jgi:glycerol-3-phosphate O-acyltransferase